MVQEVKKECYGRWYLPAGRMEEGESITEALQREVREEAGLDCQPITMLLVQERGPQWIRFAFLAEVTGGSLKTPAEADSESLQALWWDRESPLPLRSPDILALIDAGVKYRQKSWFPVSLPINLPCHVVCQRLLFTFVSSSHGQGDEGRLWLLLRDRADDGETGTRPHLPVVITAKTHTVAWAGLGLLQECMPSSCLRVTANVRGVLGVQHCGRVPGKTDGICFNTLATLEHLEEEEGTDLSCPPPLESESYRWHEVANQSLRTKILQRIKDGSLLPVHSLY
ncbi:8-oxo-dGDP phosphatase NUDT18 isoform X2 [Brachyhypopomus gauderio]